MKQQLKFLIGGFSLIALVVCHANPAEAQAPQITFTAEAIGISISVDKSGISLGRINAGATKQSDANFNPTRPGDTPIDVQPFVVTNNSSVAIDLGAAGKNGISTTDFATGIPCNRAPGQPQGVVAWVLTTGTAGRDQFNFGFTRASPFTESDVVKMNGPGSTAPGGVDFGATVGLPGTSIAPSGTAIVHWFIRVPTDQACPGINSFTTRLSGSIP